jgi:hypothetical protein
MRRIAVGFFAIVFVACVAMAQQTTKIEGYITDAKCGAKAGADLSNAACAKKCVEAGEKLVLVTDKDRKLYAVDNQDAVKGHEGHHVRVTGTVNGDSIHVEKVDMLK